MAVLKIAGTPHVDDTTGFQPDTRETIPGWDALLFIYAIFFVPTFFALIVGVNLLVWARARINYVFIFGTLPILYASPTLMPCTELDLRTRMDYRVYFEVCVSCLSACDAVRLTLHVYG